MSGGSDVTVTVVDPILGGQAHVRVWAPEGADPRAVRAAVAACAWGELASDGGPAESGDADAAADRVGVAQRVAESVGAARASPLRDGAVLVLARSPDGALTVVERARPYAVGTDPPVAEARAVGGPGAGAVVPLRPGRPIVVGRAETADLSLCDPRVSRRHAELVAEAAGVVRVRDLESANGVWLDGARVVAARLDRVDAGDSANAVAGRRSERRARAAFDPLLTVGATVLEVTPPGVQPAAVGPRSDGTIGVHRPPRVRFSAEPPVVDVPAPPAPPRRARLPAATVALPVVAGLVICAVLRTWQYLAFAMLSPLMVAGSFVSDRRASRAEHRAAVAAYDVAMARATGSIAAACAADVARRRAAAPDPATVLLLATTPGDRLWERRPGDPDFLRLRVGLGDAAAAVDVRSPPALGASGTDLPPPLARNVPVAVDVRAAGVVGVAGPAEAANALAAWLVAQAAVLHPPNELEIVLLADDGDERDWGFVRWLPHARSRAPSCHALVGLDPATIDARARELAATVTGRTAGGEPTGRATLVVVVGGAALRDRPALAALLRDGPAAGVFVVCVEDESGLLPAECRATVCFEADPAPTRITVALDGGPPTTGVLADQVPMMWRDDVARALTPLRPAGPILPPAPLEPAGAGRRVTSDSDGLPRRPRLLDVGGIGDPSPPAVAEGWADAGGPIATLGVGPSGAVRLDLRRDGPHVLVAGTTGSGKSELLQTLVASLALGQSPDDLTFVLVDYKGGAAFRECARLPHVTGLVTDLDSRLTARALASLTAELRRREAVLADAGVSDVDALRALADAPRLARLVIVVDEFATLVEELPDFVRGLVAVAARGRSLGLHLVMATQRPGGAVGADIRANTNARICLRVTSPAESCDVLDGPAAASIPEDRPGLGYLRVGSGAPTQFQTARVTMTRRVEGAERVRCAIVRWTDVGRPPPVSAAAGADATADDPADADLRAIVDAVRAASAGREPPRRPWLAPLPTVVPLASLAADGGNAAGEAGGGLRVPLGRLDVPEHQAQPVLSHDIGGAHLLVVGAAGSGRTTVLRTLAAALATALPPSAVHLYAIDGGGALGAVADLPHCGAYVARDDPDRMYRLVARLTRELDRRAAVLSRDGSPSGARLPWIVVLVDGWDAVLGVGRDGPLDPIAEGLLRVLREGGPLGVRCVVTSGRSGVTGQLAGLVPQRIVLRQADAGDYALAGVDPRAVPRAMPPGRGIVVGTGPAREAQIAVAGTRAGPGAQDGALRVLARSVRQCDRDDDAVPFRVEPLPARVTTRDVRVPTDAGQQRRPLWIDLGLGGDAGKPVGVDLARDGPALLVAGRGRSGRTTALMTAATSAADGDATVVVVAPLRGPLRDLGAAGSRGRRRRGRIVAVDDAESFDAALAGAAGPVVVVVDDVELIDDPALDAALRSALRAARQRPIALVAAGTTDDLLSAFRGLPLDLRRQRCCLLLDPLRAGDGELAGARVPAYGTSAPPGRGWLAVRGTLTRVQVAMTDDAAEPLERADAPIDGPTPRDEPGTAA